MLGIGWFLARVQLSAAVCVLALALSAIATPAAAQITTLATSDALACLTPPAAERGEPEYPFMHYKSGTKGRVLATARFAGSDIFPTPSITIEEQEGGEEFVEAVKKHLRTLRVPCLARNTQAELRFNFVFDPSNPRVLWSEPQDLADPARLEQLKCVVGLRDNKPLPYPFRAEQAGIQGRVRAIVRYVRPDQAPEIKIFHRPSARMLTADVRDWLEQRRMPCLKGEPISAELVFIFTVEGSAYGFNPLSLTQYMGAVKDINKQVLQFDTTTMGCPFALQLRYLQPDAPNRVGERGERNLARKPLMDWLAASQLNLPQPSLDSVYADVADIHVPCMKMDLKPKEKTS